jgi:hypothetical protein
MQDWYPDEWHFTETRSESPLIASAGLRSFSRPNFAEFPNELLSDEHFFERLLLSSRDLSQALSAIEFLNKNVRSGDVR